jgi:hypothetical protein
MEGEGNWEMEELYRTAFRTGLLLNERQEYNLWCDHEAEEFCSNNMKYGTNYRNGNKTGVIERSITNT